MRTLLCLLALLAAPSAMAQTRHAGWENVGQAGYARSDYGRAGPSPQYYAPGTAVTIVAPGPHTYVTRGVRVWYGTVLELAPVLTAGAVAMQGPAIMAPASPGPRVYRHASGVRVWYGAGY